MSKPPKIVAYAEALVVRNEPQTVWDSHCFVCHCFVPENFEVHQRYHGYTHKTCLTARSEGEAIKLGEFLRVYGVGERLTWMEEESDEQSQHSSR